MKDHPINSDGPRLPALLVFDVNETLSDMSPLAARFEDVGAPAHLAQIWFAELLRDGFALTVSGVAEPFARLGGEMLRVRLDDQDLDRDLDEAVQHVLGGFADLALHPDVAEGLNALANLGIRLVTLSNEAPGWRRSPAPLRSAPLGGGSGHLETRVRRVRLRVNRVWGRRGGRHAGRRTPVGHRRGSARRTRHSLDQPHRRRVPGVLHGARPVRGLTARPGRGDHLRPARDRTERFRPGSGRMPGTACDGRAIATDVSSCSDFGVGWT